MLQKKITYVVQQLERVGGSEMVSVELASSFSQVHNVTLISMEKIEKISPSFLIAPNVTVTSLNIKSKYLHLDDLIDKNKKKGKHLANVFLILQTFFFWLFNFPVLRHKLKKMTTKEEYLILTSLDSYLIAPRKRKIYFHFHFDNHCFLKKQFQFLIKFAHRPLKWFILNDTAAKEIIRAKPKLQKKILVFYNSSRFERTLDETFYDNRLIFVGRLSAQKQPLLLPLVMEKLKELGVKAHLDIYGNGSLQEKLHQQIVASSAGEMISFYGFSNHIEEEYLKSDIMLLPSKFEGFALVIIEASSKSTPTISFRWGETIDEMITDDVDGCIVNNVDEMAEKIRLLLSDKELLRAMKRQAYESSVKYDKTLIVEKWLQYFDEN